MHFNRLTTYGLVANLIAMPIMGILVMPLGVVAGLLAPFGLANLALYPMEQGLTLILSVAHEVAAWLRAVRMVVSPAPLVMPIFAAGFVGGLIWNGPMRAAFLLPMGVALWIWGQSPRPDILIAPSARLVGVMDEAGLRVPSHVRGEGFVVDLWLENDGDPATQPEAAARPLWQAEGAGQAATVKGYRVWHGRGEAALTDALSACGAADVVILAARLNPSDSPGPCLFFDARDMARAGAVALHLPQGGIGPITIETSRASQGARLWSGRSR
jgi:competence protein ComEC